MTSEIETQQPKLYYDTEGNTYVKKELKDGEKVLATVDVPASVEDLPADSLITAEDIDLTEFPKMTLKDLLFVRWYFALVYEEHRSESIVLFHRGVDDNEYTIIVPEVYTASAGHVTYNAHIPQFCSSCHIGSTEDNLETCPHCETNTMVPFRFYGSMHSHGNMSAFHSGTDDEHELGQQGFHITMGRVGLEAPKKNAEESDQSAVSGFFSICPSFVVAIPGRTTVKGKGDRWYPSIDGLVDTSPESMGFTPEQVEMTQLWTNLVLSPKLLGQTVSQNPSAAILLDIGKGKDAADHPVLYLARTPEEFKALQTWQKAQPSSRKLHITTISEYLAATKLAEEARKKSSTGDKKSKQKGLTQTHTQLTGRTTSGTRTPHGGVTINPTGAKGAGNSAGQAGRSGYLQPNRTVISLSKSRTIAYYVPHYTLTAQVGAQLLSPARDLIKAPKDFGLCEAVGIVFLAEAGKRLESMSTYYDEESPVLLALDAVAAAIDSAITDAKIDIADSQDMTAKFYLSSGPEDEDRDNLETEILEIFDEYCDTNDEVPFFDGELHGNRNDVLVCAWLACQASSALYSLSNAAATYKYNMHAQVDKAATELVREWAEEEATPTPTSKLAINS
jgi:hypothetical protein